MPRPRRQLAEAPHSLYSAVPWVPRRRVLPLVAGFLFLINLALTIFMLVKGQFHIDYYTYWNWTVTTTWLLTIALTFPIGGWLATLAAKYLTPMAIGMASLTITIILIVIAIDDRIYITGTAADPSTTVPIWTFSQIRTGDWIVHGLPILELLIVHMFDFQQYFRSIVYHWERSDRWTRRWWYWLWVYVSPMLSIALYSIIFDPRKKYTDKLTRAQGLGLAALLNLVIMTLFTLSVRMSEDDPVVIGDFYPPILHVSVSP